MAEVLVAAVDLGGTKIRSIVVDRAGRVRGIDQRSSEAAGGPQAVIGRMVESIRAAGAASGARVDDLAAVGIAAPGPVDFERGIVLEAPNLVGWSNVALAAILRDRLGRPTYLENDANAAAGLSRPLASRR